MSAHSFAWLQDDSRKTKEITVADCFQRQLSVCPQLSITKAKDIVELFPSWRCLTRLYKDAREDDDSAPLDEVLSRAVPSISAAASRQLAQFFASA